MSKLISELQNRLKYVSPIQFTCMVSSGKPCSFPDGCRAYNSRAWFRVENPVLFPMGVVLKSNENTFAFNYRRSRCDSMWGFKQVLYIFIYVIMHFLWATFVNIQLHAETDPAKSYAQIRILWNHSTAGALPPQNARPCRCNIIDNEDWQWRNTTVIHSALPTVY